jgi:hypothetical protein
MWLRTRSQSAPTPLDPMEVRRSSWGSGERRRLEWIERTEGGNSETLLQTKKAGLQTPPTHQLRFFWNAGNMAMAAVEACSPCKTTLHQVRSTYALI